MFELRTAVAAALIGAMTLAAPALAAAPTKAPAKPAAAAKPKKELHGFKRYDKNADGAITLAEFRAEFAKKPKRLARADKRFKRWDANGDGKVTKAEWDTRNHRPGDKKKKPAAPAKKK